MITEDYVSFETAKLLKEKGFDVYGDGSFGSSTKVWMEYSPFGKIRDISTSNPSAKGFPAPTLQMAMKWLRSQEIYINITFANHQFVKDGYTCQVYDYHTDEHNPKLLYPNGTATFETYEEACEATIKYCLENLI